VIDFFAPRGKPPKSRSGDPRSFTLPFDSFRKVQPLLLQLFILLFDPTRDVACELPAFFRMGAEFVASRIHRNLPRSSSGTIGVSAKARCDGHHNNAGRSGIFGPPLRVKSYSRGGPLSCPFRKSYPDIMVVQPVQDWDGDNDAGPLDCPTQRRVFTQGQVRTHLIVIHRIRRKNLPQVRLANDQHPIETLASHGARAPQFRRVHSSGGESGGFG
jgi:hypothetical protein